MRICQYGRCNRSVRMVFLGFLQRFLLTLARYELSPFFSSRKLTSVDHVSRTNTSRVLLYTYMLCVLFGVAASAYWMTNRTSPLCISSLFCLPVGGPANDVAF